MLACWEKWKILLDINQALELARDLHIIFSGRQSTVVNRIKNYTNIFTFGYKELNESEKKTTQSARTFYSETSLQRTPSRLQNSVRYREVSAT